LTDLLLVRGTGALFSWIAHAAKADNAHPSLREIEGRFEVEIADEYGFGHSLTVTAPQPGAGQLG
jgi:hypothetical protein